MTVRVNGSVMGFPGPDAPASSPCESGPGGLGRVRSFMDTCYNRTQGPNTSRWAESELDTRYYCGDQTLFYAGAGNAQLYRKRAFVFNLIRPLVQMISGRQRQHRKSIICEPQDDSDSYGCSQLTKALMWSMHATKGLETFSEAFQGALITGLDLLYVGMSWEKDPINGDPIVHRLPYNTFAMDPFWTRPDLSDCGWVWYRKIVGDDEARYRYPRSGDYLSSTGWRDGRFQYLPELQLPPLAGQHVVDEFWYAARRKALFLVDVRTGDRMMYQGDPAEAEQALTRFPELLLMEREVATVRLAIAVDGQVVEDGPNPFQTDRYPFVPLIGYYQPESAQWPLRLQGIVRGVRDPQWIYNRLKLTQLDIFESQPNSGFKYKEGSVVNPQDLLNVGQGRLIAMRQESMLSDVEQIPPPRIDASMVELAQSIKATLREVSGVNEELLGAADDDKAGILSMLRQGAGLTTLQSLFDGADTALKILGENVVDLMTSNWRPEKFERITNEPVDPKIRSGAFLRYDMVVSEGINTETQKQMQFAQLLQLSQLGIPVPPEQLLLASNLQNKHELIESIEQAAQREQQAAQAQAEAQQAEVQARAQEMEARAAANMALAQERGIKSQALYPAQAEAQQGMAQERAMRSQLLGAEMLEKFQYSERANAQAMLDVVKAIKELQEVDPSRILQLVQAAKLLQEGIPTLPLAPSFPPPQTAPPSGSSGEGTFSA